MRKHYYWRFVFLLLLVIVAAVIALPSAQEVSLQRLGINRVITIGSPSIDTFLLGRPVQISFPFKQGLDIRGGMQVVLEADMAAIPAAERRDALESARTVIQRRVDLYGIAEPVVQTSVVNDDYRLNVELPGVTDQTEALQLVGQTAQLEFILVKPASPSGDLTATESAGVIPIPVGITGKNLKQVAMTFDQQTNEPVVSFELDEEGRDIFAKVTQENIGETLGIFIDGSPIMLPRINSAILDGRAIIQGSFTVDEAKQLSIQLKAGALPVPISVLEQRSIGASLGQESVRASVIAGAVGLCLVMLFMLLMYGWKGFLADVALLMYAVLTIAIYKIMGVTLTLPGLAGMILTIGMAVDANILIFERIKEERRTGKPTAVAMEIGFGKAWDSIKDANVATLLTAIILINPLNVSFLNSSGMVRGFGITLLIGVLLGLFTGVFVTRTLLRLFLKSDDEAEGERKASRLFKPGILRRKQV